MAGLASYGAPALEGDYSDWTIYDSFDDTDAMDTHLQQGAIINKGETEILLLDWGNMYAKKYSVGTKTLSARLANDIYYFVTGGSADTPQFKSAYGTYAVVIGRVAAAVWDADRLWVFKNGSLIKTFTDSDLGITSEKIRSAHISPKGKYIVVSGLLSASGNMGWVVLVGS